MDTYQVSYTTADHRIMAFIIKAESFDEALEIANKEKGNDDVINGVQKMTNVIIIT